MAKKKSKGGTNPFMEKFKDGGGPLIRVDIEGQGEKWMDPKRVAGFDYDPVVIQTGGSEYFSRFIHYCLQVNGLSAPETIYVWDVQTFNRFWCEPSDVKQFPLSKPAPGRVRIPVYLFMIREINGKPFEWTCYAVVEEILRGTLFRYEEEWIKDYSRQIKIGILDKLTPPEAP
jgi:hypothetical protein